MAIARDKFWLFGVRPHQDDVWFGYPYDKEKARRRYAYSRITPAEGAFMLDIPNLMMVVCDGQPANFSHEAYGYMESFCRLNQVQWSCTGSGGFRSGNEEEFLCALAKEYPNVTGAYLDDFLSESFVRQFPDRRELGENAKERMEAIAKKLEAAPRPMDIHMVYYTTMMDLDIRVFEKVTMLSLWTWHSKDLVDVEKNFRIMEERFPDKKKMIGVYLFDFTGGHPVPLELMEHQCNFALQMLKEGRADGIIFEANSIMGMRMDSELWLREWIEANKNTLVPD